MSAHPNLEPRRASIDRPYRTFVQHMRDGAATLTADGLISYANQRLTQMLGRPMGEIVGMPIISFVAEEDRRVFEALLDPVGPASAVTIQLLATPFPRSVLAGAEALDGYGESLSCVTFTDLTAQRAAERQLLSSVARTAGILEASNEAFLGMDNAGRITEWNRQSEVLFGWPRDEALGRPLAETILPIEFQPGLTWFLSGRASEKTLSRRFESRAVDRYGREFPTEMALWEGDDGEGGASFFAFLHEISDRRTAEDSLRVDLDSALEAMRLDAHVWTSLGHEIGGHIDHMLVMVDSLLDATEEIGQRERLLALQQAGRDVLAIVDQILDSPRAEVGPPTG